MCFHGFTVEEEDVGAMTTGVVGAVAAEEGVCAELMDVKNAGAVVEELERLDAFTMGHGAARFVDVLEEVFDEEPDPEDPFFLSIAFLKASPKDDVL